MRYLIALLGYVAIGMLSKQYLSFTWGLLYFVTTVEVLPTFLRQIWPAHGRPDSSSADSVIER
ncbi:MAG TPA: hypothetical protein VE442_14610 [Jatrophihabitans sp.]|nr:hypothetical protein [Jatrophihabitans sp.]